MGPHDAAPPKARVPIIETIPDDDSRDRHALSLDLWMLATTGGRERTVEQLRALLGKAGLHLERVLDTTGLLRIAEAVPG